MSQPPKCIDCRHYVRSHGVIPDFTRADDCLRSVRVVGINPVNGDPIHSGWKSARFERSSFWLFWLTYPIRKAKSCGLAGRFFSPKESA